MYHYPVIGNIANITDLQAGNQVQNFTYDTLDRLLSANAVGGSVGLYSENYTYDPNTGNLSSKAGVNYTYSPTRVHAVTSLSNGNSYAYGNNGNMTSRTVGGVTYTLTYDAENRLVSLTGGGVTAAYTYDGDGNRVKTVVNGTTITYIGNYFEWSNSVGTKYYYAGSVRVAVRVGTVLDYLFSDHLGSTSITADSAGNLAGGMRYTAFGETRYTAGTTPTTFRYTGQRQAEAGLYYYVARMYDPALGRFTQADIVVPKPGNPITWDRYAYSNNNSINYSDPSGHCTGLSDDTNNPDAQCWALIAQIQKLYTNVTIWETDEWTTAELQVVQYSLDLAVKTHGGADNFTKGVGNITLRNSNWGTGMAPPGQNTIILSNELLSRKNNEASWYVVHEIGHEFDYNGPDTPHPYKSQTFVDAFAPGCKTGALGCLGTNPTGIYKFYNWITGGSGAGNYNVDNKDTTRYATESGSLDDFAESYAYYVFTSQGVNAPYQVNSYRRTLIATFVDVAKQ